MARRLGTVGYYVLLPNLYYRAGHDTIYGPDVQEEGSAEHKRMRAVRKHDGELEIAIERRSRYGLPLHRP